MLLASLAERGVLKALSGWLRPPWKNTLRRRMTFNWAKNPRKNKKYVEFLY
jgi:hypothetical protein